MFGIGGTFLVFRPKMQYVGLKGCKKKRENNYNWMALV